MMKGLAGEMNMAAKLWTKQIVLGKKEFAEVPGRLKEQVRELLLNTEFEVLTKE